VIIPFVDSEYLILISGWYRIGKGAEGAGRGVAGRLADHQLNPTAMLVTNTEGGGGGQGWWCVGPPADHAVHTGSHTLTFGLTTTTQQETVVNRNYLIILLGNRRELEEYLLNYIRDRRERRENLIILSGTDVNWRNI
jgi:hypothetical protein